MSKPDPSITADLLKQLPTRKQAGPEGGVPRPEHKEHPASRTPKTSLRSAERAPVAGHTRSSNRGK